MLVFLFSFRLYTFRLYNQFQSLYIVFCQLDVSSISVIVEHPFCAMSSQHCMFFCFHVVFYCQLFVCIAIFVGLIIEVAKKIVSEWYLFCNNGEFCCIWPHYTIPIRNR